MIEQRWQPILPHLREFQCHLANHVPELRIEAANDRMWTQEYYREHCKTGIFNRYGVYLLFSADETLKYIGVAMNSFHDRIWSHDEYVERRWTDVICIPHEQSFLSLALEFFLIVRLRPPANRVYRDYSIPGM